MPAHQTLTNMRSFISNTWRPKLIHVNNICNRRGYSSAVAIPVSELTGIDKWKDFYALNVTEERCIARPDLVVPKLSPHHGTGLFAREFIPKGTVICEAKLMVGSDDFAGEAGFINDLNYTNSRSLGKYTDAPTIAEMTYDDYQEMIGAYCNVEEVEKNTNIVMTILKNGSGPKKLHMEARRDIAKGEELSRLYTIQYWLDHHLAHMIQLNDESIYQEDHPLTQTLLELTDTYSQQLFATIRDYHSKQRPNRTIN